jgi:hypothetical protein
MRYTHAGGGAMRHVNSVSWSAFLRCTARAFGHPPRILDRCAEGSREIAWP